MNKACFAVAMGCVFFLSGCTSLDEASGPYTAMNAEFSKATSFNLAHVVNDPKHLTEPAEIGFVNSQAAVGPVDRYQRGNVRKVDTKLGSTTGLSN